MGLTEYHRLVLPTDANHHGTLYAGSLLRLALEAGYATAWRYVGTEANLVLRRVVNLECLRPVPVGTVICISGTVLYRSQAYLVTEAARRTGLVGSVDGGPARIRREWTRPGRPTSSHEITGPALVPETEAWQRLGERLQVPVDPLIATLKMARWGKDSPPHRAVVRRSWNCRSAKSAVNGGSAGGLNPGQAENRGFWSPGRRRHDIARGGCSPRTPPPLSLKPLGGGATYACRRLQGLTPLAISGRPYQELQALVLSVLGV